MPTSKQRLNLTLPPHLAVVLKRISVRDDMPQAAKAIELIESALETEEGEFKPGFVKEVLRRSKRGKLIPLDKVIKELW